MARKPAKSKKPAKAKVEASVGGRPSVYSQEVAEEICQRITEGESLTRICKDEHLPAKSTVLKWARDDKAGFSTIYAHARELQLDVRQDEIFDIADDGSNDWMEKLDSEGKNIGWQVNGEHVQRSKLRINTRQWVLTKLRPDKFGEKVGLTHGADASFAKLWAMVGSGKFAGVPA